MWLGPARVGPVGSRCVANLACPCSFCRALSRDPVKGAHARTILAAIRGPNRAALDLFADRSWTVENCDDEPIKVKLDGQRLRVEDCGWRFHWQFATIPRGSKSAGSRVCAALAVTSRRSPSRRLVPWPVQTATPSGMPRRPDALDEREQL